MFSLHRPLIAVVFSALLPLPAAATPVITSFAQYSVGPVTDTDGPQTGGSVSALVTTANAGRVCQFTGVCTGNGRADAAQNETVFGVFSALVADGVFFTGGTSRSTLTALTTWEDSPTSDGPTSISLLIKPGQLALADFAGLSTTSTTPIDVRFKIELTVVGNSTPFFFSEAILLGGKNGSTLTQNGSDLGASPFADVDFPTDVKGYDFAGLFTTVALGNLTTSDVVRYTMEVSASGPGFETGGRAFIGDPFDLANGSSIGFVPEPAVGALLALAGIALAGLGVHPKR